MAVIKGTNKDDTIFGTAKDDTIYGKDGFDTIYGGFGNDSLHGDKGNDWLLGESGNDHLYGKSGDDSLYGGIGNDTMHGDGGIDSLFGGDGNDVVKGGRDTSYLYGEDGDDDVYYNPTNAKLEKIGDELSYSYMDGGSGHDTLNLFNEATYKDENGKTQNSESYVYIDSYGTGHIDFGAQPTGGYLSPYVYAGTFSNFEEIKLNGKGGAHFDGEWSGAYDTTVTGTTKADVFSSYYAHDTMIGGGGNDEFYFGGLDKIVSGTNDADEFHFAAWYSYGTATIEHFNGAGKSGGDVLYIASYDLADPTTQVVESGGKTTFTLNGGVDALQVDATGLVQGQDWFLV